MFGTKRFIRHGLFISALGHVGIVAIGLLFLRASSQEAVPPDATLVEIVTPQEIPRFSGTPSYLRNSGSAQAARSQPALRAQNSPPQPEQKDEKEQENQKSERNAERSAPAKPHELPLQQAEAGEMAPPPDAPAAAADAAAEADDTAAAMAQFAQLALLGGRLGGGFAAPPIDSPLVGYDFTEQFRQVVSACAGQVPGVDPHEQINVHIRVFLNRDGTLAAAPQLRDDNPSPKQQTMMQHFVAGLEKCQPYTMLPPDKYKQWKRLDLVVFPLNS